MKSIYRSFLLFLSVIILSLAGTAGVAAAPSVAAYSAVVMDGDTGAYYYEKDADTMRAPASMTKLMSAYVIFEEIDAGRISYDSVVTIFCLRPAELAPLWRTISAAAKVPLPLG